MSQNVVHRLQTSPENKLETQILRPDPRPTGSETLRVGAVDATQAPGIAAELKLEILI